MNYSALIQVRRSVREFTDKQVAYRDLDSLRIYYLNSVRRLIPEVKTELYFFGTSTRAALEGSAGYNRFLTNRKILEKTKIPEGAPILVATGSNFADSLSASAVGLPILLVHKKLTAEQKAFLAKAADSKKNPIIILGGKNAVNETVEGEFKALGFNVERLAGDNRFQTSIMIAEKFFDRPNTAVLAYARNYPDGLCGGGLAVWIGAPLILTMDKQVAVAAEYAKKVGIKRTVTLGGEGLISDAAVNTILGK